MSEKSMLGCGSGELSFYCSFIRGKRSYQIGVVVNVKFHEIISDGASGRT